MCVPFMHVFDGLFVCICFFANVCIFTWGFVYMCMRDRQTDMRGREIDR